MVTQFPSLFSDEFGGVFFEEKFLIITRRTKDGSEYVYIDPHTGSEVAKTPKSKYLVGGYFNASKSAIYGVQTSSLTDKKDIGVYRILIEKGKIERVFTVPVNKYMQRQGFNVRPRVEFTQGRYLVLSIENAGRGVGFGGFIVADLLHNRIMYYEFYPDYVRYSFNASDNGNLVFSRSHSGKTENDIYRVELPTGG